MTQHPVFRAAFISAAIALFIYSLLKIGERFWPQFYPSGPVEPWMLVLLFGVAFVPRLLTWAVDWLIAKRRKARRRRKT